MLQIERWLERRTKIVQLIYILISIVGLTIGFSYYFNQKKELERKIEDELKSIAILKVSEIQAWMNERFADANVIAQSSIFNKSLEHYLKQKNKADFNYLYQKIKIVQQEYGYGEVLIVDTNKQIVLTTNSKIYKLSSKIDSSFTESYLKRNTKISDLYWCEYCNEIHLDFIAPIYNNAIIGYLILRVNPYQYLYPLINNWPTKSKTAETLIVEQIGDSAVFLNDVRHSDIPALKLKIPLNRLEVPAVRAINGETGIFEGYDYRHVKVLSYSTKIPNTNWYMISKVDTSEIYKPIRNQAWIMGTILVLTFLMLTLILIVIRNLDQKKYYKTLLDLEIKQKLLEKRYQNLVKYANDIIVLADQKGQIIEANDSALTAYQLSIDDIKKMKLADLGSFKTKFECDKSKISELKISSKPYESTHKRSNGETFPVEISEKIIEIDTSQYYQAIIRDISERKKVENELLEKENQYRTLANSGFALIWRSGTDKLCNYFNEPWLRFTGRTLEQEMGNGWAEGVHPEDIDRCLQIYTSAFDNQEPFDMEYRLRNSKGEYRWITDLGTPNYNNNGEFIGYIGHCFDITDRKKSEDKLRISEEKFRNFFEHSIIGKSITTMNGTVKTNRAFRKMVGYSEEELADFKWQNLTHPDDIENDNKIINRITTGEIESAQWEKRYIHKNGNIIWALISTTLQSDANNNPLYFITSVVNITERKLAEQAIKEAQEWFKTTLYSIGDGIITTDIDGKILQMNHVACNLTGWEENDAKGQRLQDVFKIKSEDTNIIIENPVDKVLKEGKVVGLANHTLLISKKGNAIPIADSGAPIYNENNKIIGVVLVFRSQLEERIAQKKLLESKENFQAVTENANDAIVVSLVNGKHVFANRRASEITGYSPEELMSMGLKGYAHPDEFPKLIDKIKRRLTGEDIPTQYETAILNKQGKTIPIEITASKSTWKGEPADIVIMRDISERKQIENALIESERFSRATLDGLSANIAIVDENGIILAVNNAWRNFAENNPPVLTNVCEGANYFEVCDKATGDDAELAKKFSGALKDILTGNSNEFELEYPCNSPDKERWFIARVTRFPESDLPRAVIAHENITELKKAEQALIQSEETHRFLFDQNPIPMFVYDLKTLEILKVNEATITKYGYTNDEFLNMTIKDIRPEEDVHLLLNNISTHNEAIQTSGAWRHKLKDGKIILVEIHSHSINFEGHNARLVAAFDITQRVLAEKLVKKSEERFRSTLDNMMEGCQIIGFDWRYIYINSAAEQQNRRPNEELIGNIYTEMWPGVDSTPVFAKMKDSMEQRIAHHFENEFMFPNGDSGWFELSIQPVPEGIFILSVDITERKNAEKSIKIKDELLHLTGKIAKVGGWEFDVPTMQGTWTDEVAIIHDLDPSLSTNVELGINFYAEEAKKKIENAIKEAIELANPYDLELEMVSAKGIHKWVRTMGIPLIEHGKVHKVQGIFQDITESKKAIEKLKQSEDRFRTLVESAPEAIFIQTNGQFVYANPSAQKLFNVKETNQLIGKPIIDFFHPDFRKQIKKRVHQLNVNQKSVPIVEEKGLTLNGETFDVEVSAVPFSYNSANGALVFLHDITERKKAETEIKKLNEELEQKVANRTVELKDTLMFVERIMANTSVGFAVYNETGDCILANDAIASITGGTKYKILQQNIHEIKSWQESKLLEVAKQSIKEHKTINVEVNINTSFNKSVWLDCRFTPFVSGNKNNLLLTVNDISERVKREQEIKDLNEELQVNVDQLKFLNSELEAFSYSVSHDLRAPLRAIHGFIQILNEDYHEKLDDEGMRLMSIVQENTVKMGQLIDDLLAFSRVSRTEIKNAPIDVNVIIESIFREYRNEQKQKIKFTVNQLPNIIGDTNLIHQVWVNLISNAIKYSSKKEKPQIEIGYTESDRFYEFYIKDNGAGFDMQYADKLFGVFQRLHNEREFQGTGVGLAIVQRIINKHGGTIWAQGEINKGATFYFTIPKQDV